VDGRMDGQTVRPSLRWSKRLTL